ncbi:MAG: GntR family transcriptional regulator [Roseovarius sp.]|uniref:GntR family transcriptional regulator n=1 Tax=Roseovarius sp. TaxID=1486281 RepID=UPI0032ED3373
MARQIPKTQDSGELDPLAATAYTTLLDRIVRLDLPPGSLISENSLGREMGLSRTPVREALKRLEREYLVSIMPRRGIIVTEVDLRSQIQLLEMRRGIEMRLLLRGTERASDGQRAEMKRLATEMEAAAGANDLKSYVRHDAEFDAIIEEACANRFLTQAMWPVHALVRRYWHTQVGTAGLREALDRHVRVVRAAADGDTEAVRQRLTELCDQTESYILDQMR